MAILPTLFQQGVRSRKYEIVIPAKEGIQRLVLDYGLDPPSQGVTLYQIPKCLNSWSIRSFR
jgi:hypothetical protein